MVNDFFRTEDNMPAFFARDWEIPLQIWVRIAGNWARDLLNTTCTGLHCTTSFAPSVSNSNFSHHFWDSGRKIHTKTNQNSVHVHWILCIFYCEIKRIVLLRIGLTAPGCLMGKHTEQTKQRLHNTVCSVNNEKLVAKNERQACNFSTK